MSKEIEFFEDKMIKSLAALDEEYNTIRAGRANPHVLDKITVDYWGTETPLNQVGNISVPEPRLIQIQPWESKMIKEIEKAYTVICLIPNSSPNSEISSKVSEPFLCPSSLGMNLDFAHLLLPSIIIAICSGIFFKSNLSVFIFMLISIPPKSNLSPQKKLLRGDKNYYTARISFVFDSIFLSISPIYLSVSF